MPNFVKIRLWKPVLQKSEHYKSLQRNCLLREFECRQKQARKLEKHVSSILIDLEKHLSSIDYINGEIYEPTFTIHGFRYLSILNPPHTMTVNDVECPFVHTETTLKGHFTTSNPIINQIQHNIQWGQLSNIMSLPTDCPQRNERFGWMGDAALTVN